MVLATPGTSSSRMCPSQNQETSDSTICDRLPTITFSTLAMIFLAVVATSAMVGSASVVFRVCPASRDVNLYANPRAGGCHLGWARSKLSCGPFP